SFFKGREFSSLAQMQDAALTWCTDVYGRHQHRGLDGTPPATVCQVPSFVEAERVFNSQAAEAAGDGA
uniref:hypothetical protein n=1 Tax=Rhodococcus zopfii TaxID=43772 RepID=UPI001EDCCA9E